MQILIDATPLLLRSAGVKNYTYYWIQNLRREAGNDRILTVPDIDELPPLNHERSVLGAARTNVHLASVYLSNIAPALPWFRWKRMTSHVDVFHVSNQIRHPPRNIKLTATLYDMTTRLLPELHIASNLRADESLANIFRGAAGLIAISENTKRDAVRILGLDSRRIEVIYPGVPDIYFHVQRKPVARPYALYVGTIEPRKNIDTLLDAWQGSRLEDEFDLVIAGPGGWAAEKTLARLASPPRGVRYLGYVKEEELPELTASASVFVYPSLYEGFGIPVAQAMAAGVPVITSNTSCLPEVAGEAALLVDPRSPAEIGTALEKLFLSDALRQQLGEAGRERAQQYRWEISARKSLDFFRRV
jgi:glycosyltransferase involved in cell wall biosynthesis